MHTYLTVKEAACLLGVSPDAVRRAAMAGAFQAYRAPGRRSHIRIRLTDLEGYLRPIRPEVVAPPSGR